MKPWLAVLEVSIFLFTLHPNMVVICDTERDVGARTHGLDCAELEQDLNTCAVHVSLVSSLAQISHFPMLSTKEYIQMFVVTQHEAKMIGPEKGHV